MLLTSIYYLDSGSSTSQAQTKRALITLEDESIHVVATILAVSAFTQSHESIMIAISFCVESSNSVLVITTIDNVVSAKHEPVFIPVITTTGLPLQAADVAEFGLARTSKKFSKS